MDAIMTSDEVRLARRIIGLRGTACRARGNGWSPKRMAQTDRTLVERLVAKGHAVATAVGAWRMTGHGIQQLKLQIGEFAFSEC